MFPKLLNSVIWSAVPYKFNCGKFQRLNLNKRVNFYMLIAVEGWFS